MLDYNELSDVYNGNDPTQDPGPKPKPKPKNGLPVIGLPTPRQKYDTTPWAVNTELSPIDVTDPNTMKYAPSGGIPSWVQPGADLEHRLSQAQGAGRNIINSIKRFLPDTLASVLDGAGSILNDLPFQWGDDRTYSNWFKEQAQEVRSWINDKMEPNYRNNPEDILDYSDPAFWTDNIEQLLSFVTSMYLTARVLGPAASRLGSVLSSAANLRTKGSNAVQTFMKYATNATISYTEGAMAAYEVYNQTYDYQLNKALDEGKGLEEAQDIAKYISAQSAATTAQLATLLTMGINANAYNPWFKTADNAIVDVLAARVTQSAGKPLSTIAADIRGIADDVVRKKAMAQYGAKEWITQTFKEGGEEVLQQYAQDEGTRLGKDGKVKGFLEQFGNLEEIIGTAASDEGILSFALGAGFGGLQHTLVSNIPVHRITKYNADGTPVISGVNKNGTPKVEQKWVSARTRDVDMSVRNYKSFKEAAAADFDYMNKLNNELSDPKTTPQRADEIRNQLFMTGQMHAVKTGILEPWINTYTEIGNLSQEEAIKRGYAANENDTSYKDKAQQAITDLNTFNKEYNQLNLRYGTKLDGGDYAQPYVDMVFGRKVDLHYQKANIDKWRDNLDKSKDDIDLAGGTKLRTLQRLEKSLRDDIVALDSGNPDDVLRIMEKYKVTENTEHGRQSLKNKLVAKADKAANDLTLHEEQIKLSPVYQRWEENMRAEGLTPDFNIYRHEAGKVSDEIENMSAYLEEAEARYDVSKSNLESVLETHNRDKFIEAVKKYQKKLETELENEKKARESLLADLAKDNTAKEQQEKNEALMELMKLSEDMKNNQDRHAAIIEELKNPDTLKDAARVNALKAELDGLVTKQEAAAKRVNEVAEKYNINVGEKTVTKEELTNTTPKTILEEYLEEDSEEDDYKGNEEENIINRFSELFEKLPAEVQKAVIKYIEMLIEDPSKATLNYLNSFVTGGIITQEQAVQILSVAQEYAVMRAKEEKIKEPAQSPVENPVQNPVTVSTIEPDSPEITSSNITIDLKNGSMSFNSGAGPISISEDNPAYHDGLKIIEAAVTGATSTLQYMEGMNDAGDAYIKVQDNTKLDETFNHDVLTPGKLSPGTELEFVVDTDYDGPKHITDSLTWDDKKEVVKAREKGTDYLNEDGTVKSDVDSISNVPIKVLDKKGKVVFYIRTMRWINAQFPGTTDYRNVVDVILLPDGEVIDNIQLQRDELYQIRKAIVDRFNNNQPTLTGKMTDKGVGKLIFNTVIKQKQDGKIRSNIELALANNLSNPEKSMLPDTSLELAIAMDGGALHSGYKYESTKVSGLDEDAYPKGTVWAVVPAANKSFIPIPLIGNKLFEEEKPSPAINTVQRVLEVFLNGKTTEETKAIENHTGFDILTPHGLHSFINQYFTYTETFFDNELKDASKQERFVFSIDLTGVMDRSKKIKVGWIASNEDPIYAALNDDGTLSKDFIEALQKGFQYRSNAVVFTNPKYNLKGINSSGTFNTALYVPGKGWKMDTHTSYNEYVKSFSKTPVYGRNKLSNGQYVYVANPRLEYSIDSNELGVTIAENTTATAVNVPDTPASPLDELDSLMNLSPIHKVVQAIGTAPENSKPLSITNLREMYNFTPEAQRNGKTVLEVYEELSDKGISFIVDGSNPFIRCG